MGNLGWGRRSNKVWRRDQEIGFSKVLQIDLCFWKESKSEDADKKSVGLCDRSKERVCVKERKVYSLSREKKEEVHKFIKEQLRKEYIRPLKLPQIVLVFFVEKKNGKKWMI